MEARQDRFEDKLDKLIEGQSEIIVTLARMDELQTNMDTRLSTLEARQDRLETKHDRLMFWVMGLLSAATLSIGAMAIRVIFFTG